MSDILEIYFKCRHWVNGKCHTFLVLESPALDCFACKLNVMPSKVLFHWKCLDVMSLLFLFVFHFKVTILVLLFDMNVLLSGEGLHEPVARFCGSSARFLESGIWVSPDMYCYAVCPLINHLFKYTEPDICRLFILQSFTSTVWRPV